MKPDTLNYEKTVTRISSRCMAGNLLLAAFKFAAGILGHSYAMLSDAVHSSSDVLGSLILMIGVHLSGREADADHPYGHERFESIASLGLAGLLAAAGFEIGKTALDSLLTRAYLTAPLPGRLALIAAALSIAVKEGMYRYVMRYSRSLASKSLRAEAWHHRSDALSSVGALVGILGARAGLPMLDPIACALISLLILKAALEVFRDGIGQMTDHACDAKLENDIRTFISAQPAIIDIDLLRTRQFGRKVYMDLEVRMDAALSLKASHQIAEGLHDLLEARFPQLKHVMIHVNPGEPADTLPPSYPGMTVRREASPE